MIRIGPLQVDLVRRKLHLDGQPVRLGSRAFDILAVLIASNGALVSKNEILKQVWPDTIVEENNLQVHMSALRKVLGESRGLIQTVSGRGYRLVLAGPSTGPSGESEANRDDELDNVDDSMQGRIVPHNLPSSSSALIGREKAMEDVALALASARHVTVIGSGGIGKTRLAIEVARDLRASFPDGVYLVSLASACDATSVLAMFATSIGVNPASGPLTLARVSKKLSERCALFIFDNCEHVLGPAAELAETLLNVSAAIRVLATSREPLRVVNERLYWVAPLQVPAQQDPCQDVLQCSAVKLFLSRARAIDARFSTDERSVCLTGTVCRRLDGIPLAIELAAARAAVLGIETLADHLDDRFNMLNGGNRTALPRHQTLKATLDWSHALLDDAERATLRRLGIFVNSFTMEAAIAVAGDGAFRELDVIAAVSGLVEKSLVVMRVERGKASYRLLETTRAYAMQKLEDNGERRLVTLNHARYFSSLIGRNSPGGAAPGGALPDQWHHRMRELLDDLRAALGWALSPKGDEALGETLAVQVVFLLYELSLVDECSAWARRALDTVAATHRDSRSTRHLRVRMQLLVALGSARVCVDGQNRETLGIWAEILAFAIVLGRSGQREEGIAAVVRALAQCDETGDHWYAGELRRIHGELLLMENAGDAPSAGDARDAEACLSAALEESLVHGCRSLQLRAATSLGRLWHAQGRSAEAAALLKSACSRLTAGLDWDDFKAATQLLQIAAVAGQPAETPPYVCDDAFANRNAAAPAFDHPPAETNSERG